MQCPGQDSRYWDNEAIFEANCSKCGTIVEFFKDDNKRKCRQCGNEMLNPKIDFGCASYCPYAEQCLGSLPPEMIAKKQELLIDRVAIESKKMLAQDFAKISLMTKAARFANTIIKTEDAANKAVVMIATYFLPFATTLTEAESKATAIEQIRSRLTSLGANPGIVDEVCTILSDPLKVASDGNINHCIVHDSLILSHIASNPEGTNRPALLTKSAQEQAKQLTQNAP
nr:phosphohydrolase [Desulfobulbaceae bacterium]